MLHLTFSGAWHAGRWHFASFNDGAGYWFFRQKHKGVYGSDEVGVAEGLVASSFSVVLDMWAFLIDEGGYVSVDGLGERALEFLAKIDPAGSRSGVDFWRRALGLGDKPGAKRR